MNTDKHGFEGPRGSPHLCSSVFIRGSKDLDLPHPGFPLRLLTAGILDAQLTCALGVGHGAPQVAFAGVVLSAIEKRAAILGIKLQQSAPVSNHAVKIAAAGQQRIESFTGFEASR